jgi:CRISPR-associated protein Cas5h
MMSREFVIFDVTSDMAHFRRQYAITTALTYVIPPRTALCGLVGAVLGLPKNQSLDEFRDDNAIFSVQVLNHLRTGSVSINLLDTKGNPTFRPKPVNPRTAMRYEILLQPRYRVMFSHDELAPRLKDKLDKHESCYTPCLGLAWMIAWFEGEARVLEAENVRQQELCSVVSPIRSADLDGEVQWATDGVYQRIRLPAEMQPDRRVTRYEEYIIDTTGRPIQAHLRSYWRLSDGTCFSAM